MPQSPFVSVIMPVYNTERYVAGAVESILGQTYRNYEFLIADGGSTDKSRTIVDRYAAQDTRIRVWARPNTSPQERLNEMLDQAQGELVARMDADDVALPERLELQAAFLQANPGYFVVGSEFLLIDPDGYPICVCGEQQTHEEIEALQLTGKHGSVIAHSATMYRREPVLAVGKYCTEYYFGDDLDLFLKLGEHGGRQANLPQVLMKIRMHFKSVCHKDRMLQDQSIQGIARNARRRRGLPDHVVAEPESSGVPDKLLGQLDYSMLWGWWALKAGYARTAQRHGWYCVTHAPLSKESWRLLYCSVRGR
jgi:glycosyltransferase involved in cell wall biosynthesis